ncbi:hypothetical protein GH714_019358 [Hevea brasiliensis]|uniref:Uncharacterized protein n=1 Tax=Hevea brasiliensis TaxID=3981 RepID=A0A6A6LKN5_HEVBR|nr:hypothetical protein GH714_019358 [Hevea brasiliensis]
MTRSAVVGQEAVRLTDLEELVRVLHGDFQDTKRVVEKLRGDMKQLREEINKNAEESNRNVVEYKQAIERLASTMGGLAAAVGKLLESRGKEVDLGGKDSNLGRGKGAGVWKNDRVLSLFLSFCNIACKLMQAGKVAVNGMDPSAPLSEQTISQALATACEHLTRTPLSVGLPWSHGENGLDFIL